MSLDERSLSTLVVVLAVAVAVLAAWAALIFRDQRVLRSRLRRVFADDARGGLDEVLDREMGRIDKLTERLDALNTLQRELEAAAQRAVSRVGVVRFNPFPDMGGDQSFAIALLDVLGNGVVVSSIHGRGETRVFAKSVAGGRSTHQLSDEEQDAIRRALAGGS
ncbi:MAG TPA: DUF4446 family protein [Candidatus Limnocylindria bacterium]|nr:DUF4446 family protein [Candidatus Limnocylindria bacterium]